VSRRTRAMARGNAIEYVIGAVLMLIAAVVALVWGVDAEQESLEEVTEPLSAEA
jgi:hypothetical protein